MDIKEIVAEGNDPVWVIGRLKEKSIRVPAWATLDKAYDPKKHPVKDKKLYPPLTLPSRYLRKIVSTASIASGANSCLHRARWRRSGIARNRIPPMPESRAG